MFLQLFKLQLLKAIRSVTFGRKILNGVIVTVFGFFILLSIMGVGFGLPEMLRSITNQYNVIPVLNALLIFFFLLEIMYRFFLQKMTVLELENYLHLPIGRPKIIHFLLFRSFISPYNLVAILLFTPFYWTEVSRVYSPTEAIFWLLNILFLSWTLHWVMIWYKQKYGDTLKGFFVLLGIFTVITGTFWYGWLDIRRWLEPVFSTPLQNPAYVAGSALLCIGGYALVYNFYKKHAYLEELQKRGKGRTIGGNISLFDKFGTAGIIANMELKLILRHKKSRAYLFISFLFLAYGLIFYTGDIMDEMPWISLAVGILITGMFIMHYGQLYLSWNSPYFDFFLSQNKGIKNLVQGKYVIFASISIVSFIFTIPYIYFGLDIFLIHAATFLFNIGINIHIIVWLALWKPKPMDLDSSSMFNYEGIGIAQFLMAFPMLGLPYAIYVPVRYFADKDIGLMVLAFTGIIGIAFYKQITQLQANLIHKKRYAISASFRQEL